MRPSTGATPSFSNAAKQLDSNQDGLIQLNEASNMTVRRIVELADANNDGALSEEEFRQEMSKDAAAGALRAVRLGGSGDITQSHAVWQYFRSLPDVPSPLVYRGVVYSLRNGGILTALDAKTGEVLKQGPIREAIDSYYASLVAGDGKIYALSETGKLTIIRAGGGWEPLGTTELGEDTYASPALAEDSVLVRTSDALYRFGK